MRRAVVVVSVSYGGSIRAMVSVAMVIPSVPDDLATGGDHVDQIVDGRLAHPRGEIGVADATLAKREVVRVHGHLPAQLLHLARRCRRASGGQYGVLHQED